MFIPLHASSLILHYESVASVLFDLIKQLQCHRKLSLQWKQLLFRVALGADWRCHLGCWHATSECLGLRPGSASCPASCWVDSLRHQVMAKVVGRPDWVFCSHLCFGPVCAIAGIGGVISRTIAVSFYLSNKSNKLEKRIEWKRQFRLRFAVR